MQSSDFRHNVVTPTFLLLGELLNRVTLSTTSDLVKGCFGVSVLLHAVSASKRFTPEVINFLHATLLFGCGIEKAEVTTTPAKKKTSEPNQSTIGNKDMDLAAAFTAPPSATRLQSSLQSRQMNFVSTKSSLAVFRSLLTAKKPAAEVQDLHLPLTFLFATGDIDSAGVKQQLLATVIQLIHQSAQLWQSLATYAECFQPIADVIAHILAQQSAGSWCHLPPTLQQYLSHLLKYLQGSAAHSVSLRTPLAASLAPLALKQHNPLFVEGYNPTKDYDPIKERAAQKELTHKLKREKKGALRELRRDTAVVIQQQNAIQAAYAAEREAKRKETWQQMEEQQRDTNIMQRASKKADKKEQDKKKKR